MKEESNGTLKDAVSAVVFIGSVISCEIEQFHQFACGVPVSNPIVCCTECFLCCVHLCACAR